MKSWPMLMPCLALCQPLLDPSCESGWHLYNGNCYFPSNQKKDQPTALTSRCQDAFGANLVSISDIDELNFVVGLL